MNNYYKNYSGFLGIVVTYEEIINNLCCNSTGNVPDLEWKTPKHERDPILLGGFFHQCQTGSLGPFDHLVALDVHHAGEEQ